MTAELRTILEFTEFIGSMGRSGQRDRVVRAARVPLTGAGVAALRVVARYAPITLSDVAKRLGVDQSTSSRQVRPLEEHGFVRRTPDENDRRVSRLSLTAKGADALERIDEVILNDFDVAMGDWSSADRKELAELLDRFRTALRHTRTDATGWSVAKEE